MITKNSITDLLVSCEDMTNKTPWTRNFSIDEIIKEIFAYAKENDGLFECDVLVAPDDYDLDTLGSIQLLWCRQVGFYAKAVMFFDNSKEVEIDLSEIKMKNYGDCQLPDFEEVIDKGIELFNNYGN